MMKKIGLLGLCLMIAVAANADPRCKDQRCVNPETRAFWGFTFTPSFKAQYDIKLIPLDSDKDCKTADPKNPADVTTIPGTSYFRQTLDFDAQTPNEMVVHIYEVPQEQLAAQAAIDKYFSNPFRLCLNEKAEVEKSLYRRVGGVNTGLLVVPFKLRDGDIYSDATIGPYLSYKFGVMEFLGTAGLSQVSVSEVGTEEVTSETGLTVALGVNFEIQKNWDVAVLVGADHLSGSAGDNWEFQDEPWISFAIGFNFTR